MNMNLSENARIILEKRYLDLSIRETPEQRFKAVADRVASVEEDSTGYSKAFYEKLLAPLKFSTEQPNNRECDQQRRLSVSLLRNDA